MAQSSHSSYAKQKATTASAADPASSDPRFSSGPHGTSPGGLSERARASQPFPTVWRVSGPPWTTPKGQPASIMSTRAPATALRREAICLPVFELVAEAPQKSAHHQHQRGPAEGGCVLHGGPTRAERARGGENTRAVRGLASGFYLRCPPVGAAPRIYIHI